MAKSLMIQGTGSGAGKSLMVTAICRILSDAGCKVAPFKAQNMALNSFITKEGGEIGRAQALQAEAARVEPTADMNPILLKASGDMGSQVIIQGKVHTSMKAGEYYRFKESAWEKVIESYARLSSQYDFIIMEGAGSPAEINLLDVDIVNMAMARHARAPVLLVGDIDKGGVFASLYGTIKLLGREGKYFKGFLINKFRGDLEILRPGLSMIEEKTGRPVIGVLPYMPSLALPEEDGLSLSSQRRRQKGPIETDSIRVVVVRLPFISNFTDFDPFLNEPDVELIFSTNHADLVSADLIILPGTKKTADDLKFLRERRLDFSIEKAHAQGIPIIGICGGFQMLGQVIRDPYGVESGEEESRGLGLLEVESTFEKVKITCQTEGRIIDPARFGLAYGEERKLNGYEIHMGVSAGDLGLFEFNRLSRPGGICLDGSARGCCWGTYLHGIFENDFFRRAVINQARTRKGLPVLQEDLSYREFKEQAIDNLALVFKENVDMDFIKKLIGL